MKFDIIKLSLYAYCYYCWRKSVYFLWKGFYFRRCRYHLTKRINKLMSQVLDVYLSTWSDYYGTEACKFSIRRGFFKHDSQLSNDQNNCIFDRVFRSFYIFFFCGEIKQWKLLVNMYNWLTFKWEWIVQNLHLRAVGCHGWREHLSVLVMSRTLMI